MNAIPGGPFNSEKAPSPEVKAMLLQRFNLDKPILEQFWIYLGNIVRGDFGISLRQEEISLQRFSNRFPFPQDSA
jgi:oligopeptide transport system permease protein